MAQRYVANPHLAEMKKDNLYHLNILTDTHNLPEMFSDVKFVCIGGSPARLTRFAEYLKNSLSDVADIAEDALKNLTRPEPGPVDRYVLYKVGPVLVASHGIGVPSMSILMHEVFKLLSYAGAKDVKMFRLGTSGGLGLNPGSIVLTEAAVNPEGEEIFEQFICGKKRVRKTVLDQDLVREIQDTTARAEDRFDIVRGKTMCADDFYEAQGRLDGALCDYTMEDKQEFIKRLHSQGVRNIEMEATAFAALTSLVNMKGAIVCVTLVDRLIDDQVSGTDDERKEWEERLIVVFCRYVRHCITQHKTT